MSDLHNDLSQAELLCYQPAHELCRSYRKHDLVETVTNVIIIMLIIIVIGILLWVNTKGWDLPLHSPRKRWGDDVEGQVYCDTEDGKGQGQEKGREIRPDSVEGFVETIRRLAVEGKISWEAYEDVERVRKGQVLDGRREHRGGNYGGAVTNKTTSRGSKEKVRVGGA